MNNFISHTYLNPVLEIGLENLQTFCSIGIFEFEKNAPQPIIIQLRLGLNKNLHEINSITDTLNYSSVAEQVKITSQSQHFLLIENLMHTLVTDIFNQWSVVQRIFIKIAKPHAVAFAQVSVQAEIVRSQG